MYLAVRSPKAFVSFVRGTPRMSFAVVTPTAVSSWSIFQPMPTWQDLYEGSLPMHVSS